VFKTLSCNNILLVLVSLLVLPASFCMEVKAATTLGIFETQGDIGTLLHSGSASYDSKSDVYIVSSSGENMWFTSDDFHFVWKKVSGDISLAADITLAGHTGAPHRKAMLMIRQSLDADSPYVDLAQHGVGKTSLQFRDARGDITHTIASYTYMPHRIQLLKRGEFYYFLVSGKDGKLRPTGASTQLRLTEPFYVGLGVCAHDRDAVERATFSHVSLTESAPKKSPVALYSTLETIAVGSGDRQVEYVAPGQISSPNWSRDGLFLVFNGNGGLFRIPVKCGAEDTGCAPDTDLVRIDTDLLVRVDNHHGISPNGQLLAITAQSQGEDTSSVYVVPIVGGFPRKVTGDGQWQWHGWSPDGKTLVLTGERNGKTDIYSIPVAGGEPTQLTTAVGDNYNPEYSSDGIYIYFNSDRTGSMQIWRVRTDGSAQEQVVSDLNDDRFPHLSPDGRWLVFLSYGAKSAEPVETGSATLFLLSLKDRKVRALATLLGGRGTIDAPSWSPDSTRFAFVSYSFLPSDATAARP
jgi:TolB protein